MYQREHRVDVSKERNECMEREPTNKELYKLEKRETTGGGIDTGKCEMARATALKKEGFPRPRTQTTGRSDPRRWKGES